MTAFSPTSIRVAAVVGPTASGKTALSIELAKRLDTEIISADSMQFYRGMEIGTAAPTAAERASVPHHFVSFLEPHQLYSAGAFAKDAMDVVERLNAQGKVAVVAGGSGLYVSALVDGLFDGPARNEAIRERLHREAEFHGPAPLYERLQEVDPHYAQIVLPHDLRRIVRGLEVYEITGQPISHLHQLHQREKRPIRSIFAGIEYPRDVLYARIDERVDRMIADGLADEVQRLLDSGYGCAISRLKSLGYRELAAYLRGEQTLDAAIEQMKMHTRRFAKRQLSWYRGDERVRWLRIEEYPNAHAQADAVMGWIKGQ
jgi:tRNA dimethylallyltransferase